MSSSDTPRLLVLPESRGDRLTHYLFRFPAKFHPPVVAALLQQFTEPGSSILDPFVGSGTTLVEASIHGRSSVGFDVDPVAVEVARAKTRRYDLAEVDSVCALLNACLLKSERPDGDYQNLMRNDISEEDYLKTVASEGLWVPNIPRLFHWFRKYVLIDLSRILSSIMEVSSSEDMRTLLRVVFASIIRNASNADPVPVSGLEYTSHMKRKDAEGRLVNPYFLMRTALRKARISIVEYNAAVKTDIPEPQVLWGDATTVDEAVSEVFDAVITSPPYHNAVDYYRRHQLEMFWLGFTSSQAEREKLLPRYVGRPRIAAKDPLLSLAWEPAPLVKSWELRIRELDAQRASDFRHYIQAMGKHFKSVSSILRPGSPLLMVVGHSSWNGAEIPTGDLFSEIAEDFSLRETLYYPIKNRYMSYSRRNDANIDREYVLVFERR